jgi:N6-adenosine-specific RNA methylase IME4
MTTLPSLTFPERMYSREATEAMAVRLAARRELMGLRHHGTFRVIYADPPWSYANWSDKAHGSAKSNYAVMTPDDIYNLGPAVSSWAAEDCVLLLWATWPKLLEAFETIHQWGFTYKTACPWVKTHPPSEKIKTGIGFWWQGASEILLVATRGNPKPERLPIIALLSGDERQFYAPPGGKHSVKPTIHQWISEKCHGPYMELFATKQTLGWFCAGLSLGLRITPYGLIRCAPVEHGVPEEAPACPTFASSPTH